MQAAAEPVPPSIAFGAVAFGSWSCTPFARVPCLLRAGKSAWKQQRQRKSTFTRSPSSEFCAAASTAPPRTDQRLVDGSPSRSGFGCVPNGGAGVRDPANCPLACCAAALQDPPSGVISTIRKTGCQRRWCRRPRGPRAEPNRQEVTSSPQRWPPSKCYSDAPPRTTLFPPLHAPALVAVQIQLPTSSILEPGRWRVRQ